MYFQFEDKFYQQKESMAIRNSQFPVISNIFLEHFEEIALDIADHKPTKWLRYVDAMATWTSRITAISSPSQQHWAYH
jgi:hypothetical protein